MMIAAVWQPVVEAGVVAAAITAVLGMLALLGRIVRHIARVAAISEEVAAEFDPHREGGTLPNQVARIEVQVERIADGISQLTADHGDYLVALDRRVTRLEQREVPSDS